MKKGISIWSFPAAPLCKNFELAKDAGFDGVEVALDEVGYDGWVSAEMIPNYKYYTEAIIYNTSCSMDKILGRK